MTKTKVLPKAVNDKVVVFTDDKEETFASKSQMFKYLYDNFELTVGEIAKLTGARYQFVYSIMDTYTAGNIRSAKSTGPSKSELFREDYLAGLTVGQIAKKHNANYTFVHTTIKKYKLSLEISHAREIISTPAEQ